MNPQTVSKKLKFPLILLIFILATSSIVQAAYPPTQYFGDFPSFANYVVKTDGSVYWSVRQDGAISASSGSAQTVEQNCVNALTSGGTILLQEVQLNGGVTYGADIIFLESYQGKMKVYSTQGKGILLSQLASDPSTVGWGATQRGFWWYNTADNKIKFWDGTQIQVLPSIVGGSANVTLPYAYTIYKSGSTYYAEDSAGNIDASGTNASDIILYAINASTSTVKQCIKIVGSISLSTYILVNSSYVVLDLRECKLSMANSANKNYMVYAIDKTNIEVHGGWLYGNSPNQAVSTYGIYFRNVTDFQIVGTKISWVGYHAIDLVSCNNGVVDKLDASYCNITNAWRDGIMISSQYGNASNIRVTNSYFHDIQGYPNARPDYGDAGGGIEIKGWPNSTIINIRVTGCTFKKLGEFGVATSQYTTGGYPYIEGLVWSNNYFEDCSGYGLNLVGGRNSVISGNIVNKTEMHGIQIYTTNMVAEGNVVSGNTLVDCGTYAGYSVFARNAIYVNNGGVDDNIITHNVIRHCPTGIKVNGGDNNTISNNHISLCTVATNITTGADANTYTNNRVICTTGLEIHSSDCDLTFVNDNDFYTCGTDVVDAGTGTVFGDNRDQSGTFDAATEP